MKHFALAAAIAVPGLLAQQNIVYHDDPSAVIGSNNAFPFGANVVRTQQLIPQAVLGGSPALIQDLFVNPQVSNTVAETQIYYGDFEISMGLTQLTTLTNTWATNLPNPTTVYRGPLVIRFVRNTWVPIGLPNSYLWAPTSPSDNLVIDFICRQVIDMGQVPPSSGYFMNSRTSPTSSISRAYRLSWTAGQTTSAGVDGSGIKLGFLLGDGNFVTHNGSCAGSSGQRPTIGALPSTWPQLGQNFAVTLSSGPPNSIALLVLGVDTATYGGIALPFDMGLLGATGCRFWHGWDVLRPAAFVDPTGAATDTLAIPAGPWTGFRLYSSWLCLDLAANAFGFVPSGFATLIL
jgi:hypothetical protein